MGKTARANPPYCAYASVEGATPHCRQWGYHNTSEESTESGVPLYFPTSFTRTSYKILATDVGANLMVATNPAAINYANWKAKLPNGQHHDAFFYWIAVGR